MTKANRVTAEGIRQVEETRTALDLIALGPLIRATTNIENRLARATWFTSFNLRIFVYPGVHASRDVEDQFRERIGVENVPTSQYSASQLARPNIPPTLTVLVLTVLALTVLALLL